MAHLLRQIVIHTHALDPPQVLRPQSSAADASVYGLWQAATMQQPVRPLAASAVGGDGGFSAVVPLSLREWRGRTCREVVSFSSSGKGGEEQAAPGETPKEARRRLAELDKLLEGLVEPKMRPPTPPPPPGNSSLSSDSADPACSAHVDVSCASSLCTCAVSLT